MMDMEMSGPLEEIEFWRQRSLDLGGIHKQINRPVRVEVKIVIRSTMLILNIHVNLLLQNVTGNCIHSWIFRASEITVLAAFFEFIQ